MSNPFRYFNTEIIRLAALMYVKYPLSLGLLRADAPTAG